MLVIRSFFAAFSTDSKSASNSAFFDTHIENIWAKYFLGLICTFLQTCKSNVHETAQKIEKSLCKCVLEFNFCIHLGVRTVNLLKKVNIDVAFIHTFSFDMEDGRKRDG